MRRTELKTAGLTYEQIVVELGHANRGTVFRLVTEALKAHTVEAVKQFHSLEVARLDQLQLGGWQKALARDVHAATVASRVIMTRCRLLGLEGPGLLSVDTAKPRTVVVRPVS
jgi:hypothetical protein